MSKIVLVTGATAGIGRHAALALAARGFHVIATGRRTDALDELKAEASGKLDVLRLDVTDAASIQEAVAQVAKLTKGKGLDVLVNNAGYGMAAPLIETTDEDLRQQYDTNVFGLMAVTRAFVPQMMERRSGRVINVSSVGGRVTMPFFGAYNSTKYAVESLSDALRLELLPFGIDVSLVEPGPIRSEFADKSMSYVEKYKSPDSPFAPIYARAEELRKQTEASSAGPEVTTRAIVHAVSASRPRVRYVVPGYLRIALLFMKLMPSRLLDAVFRRFIGLSRDKLNTSRERNALASA